MERVLSRGQADQVAMLWMAMTVLIWGTGWVIMKSLASLIGPFDLVALRYALGFLTLLIMVVATKRPLAFPPFWLTIGIAVFQTTAYQCFVQMALITGGTGRVIMVAYTMPFWLTFLAWFVLGDRPTSRHWTALALAALGLLAVMSPWQGMGGMQSSLLAMAGGISWAVGTIFSKLMFQRHRPDIMSLTMWQLLLGALMVLPFAWWMPQQQIVWSAHTVLGIAYLGVFASAVAWALWLLVVRRVDPTVAGMSGLGVPVVAIIVAWLTLGEQPTALEFIGIALVMAGLVVVNLAPQKR